MVGILILNCVPEYPRIRLLFFYQDDNDLANLGTNPYVLYQRESRSDETQSRLENKQVYTVCGSVVYKSVLWKLTEGPTMISCEGWNEKCCFCVSLSNYSHFFLSVKSVKFYIPEGRGPSVSGGVASLISTVGSDELLKEHVSVFSNITHFFSDLRSYYPIYLHAPHQQPELMI